MSTETAPQPTTAVANPPTVPIAAGFDARDLVRISATTDQPQPERQLTPVAKLIDVSKCIGCKACPAPGAIVKYANGIVDFISENCIGCGYCIKGCPFNVPRLNAKDSKAYKCTLCSDRVGVGLEPACVKTCPTGAIGFGTKDDMVAYGEKRASELKDRGFANAGLYNPPGVGGTHVMYVLKHADEPALVGLPAEASISPVVSLWKGIAKPLAVAGMIGAVVAGFFHYMKVGPIEEKADEKEGA